MDLKEYLVDKYGYSEPILMEDLQSDEDLGVEGSALRMNIKRLIDSGQLEWFSRGIYFLPDPNSLLKKQSLSINKVIQRKYLYDKKRVIGYRTGIAFANTLKLTNQTAGIYEVVTNKETNIKRQTHINNWRIILRKPQNEVNESNKKILQVLDLLSDYENMSEVPLDDAAVIIIDYLQDVKIATSELNRILYNYSKETFINLNESGIYNAITQ